MKLLKEIGKFNLIFSSGISGKYKFPCYNKEITISVTLSRSEHEISNDAKQQDHRVSGTALEGWFSTGGQNVGCSFAAGQSGHSSKTQAKHTSTKQEARFRWRLGWVARGVKSSHALGLTCKAHLFFLLAFLLTACDEFIVNFNLKYLQNYVIFNFGVLPVCYNFLN